MDSRCKKGHIHRVNILKKVRLDGNWKLLPALVEPNGRLKDKVRVGEKTEVHPEGTYYIEWWEERKRKRRAVPYRDEVIDMARRKALAVKATKAGLQVASEITRQTENLEEKTRLDVSIREFLKDVQPPQREPKTHAAYKDCLDLFLTGCSKSYVQDIEREDLLRFIRSQYDLGCGARTVYNRANIVAQFLKLNGVTGLLHKRDWPEYVDTIRKIYEVDELKPLFVACDASERARYLFFLMTGERDKEVRFTTWRDIDFRRGTVRVTAKPQLGFKPKNKEEREIPVPSSLLEALKEYKKHQTGPNPFNLIFPTEQEL